MELNNMITLQALLAWEARFKPTNIADYTWNALVELVQLAWDEASEELIGTPPSGMGVSKDDTYSILRTDAGYHGALCWMRLKRLEINVSIKDFLPGGFWRMDTPIGETCKRYNITLAQYNGE